MKKVAIIGGGFSALNLAWQLSDFFGKKVSIEIFEQNPYLGGLAAGFREKNWDWALDNHYHHLFAKDQAFIKFLKDLSLTKLFFYKKTITSTRIAGKHYQLDSAFSLLLFKQLSLIDRLRTGLVLAFLKLLPNGQFLERYRASDFLVKTMGKKSWQIIWQPLFKAKFANWAEEINMAWFWARIKPRTSKLGYVEGGFQSLANQIQLKLIKKGVKINFNHKVNQIELNQKKTTTDPQFNLYFKSLKNNKIQLKKNFDLVISTLPSPQFKELIDLPELKNHELKGLAAATLILRLSDKFLQDKTYWLNINEQNWPFVAVVEHSNFIHQQYYNGEYLVYLGRYLAVEDQAYQYSAKKLYQSYLPFLRQLNPKIEKLLIDYHLTKETFAQPLVFVKHSQYLPNMRTSYPKLYWVSMQHIYPYDRGLNQAIASSQQLFELIKKDCET